LTLDQAHDRVSHLELAVHDELPQVTGVHSHIEPSAQPVAPQTTLDSQEEDRLRAQIVAVASGVSGLRGCDRLYIRSGTDGYDVTLHCLADPNLTVTQAHRLADEVEKRIRTRVPGVSQVLVHVEPDQES
jgi:divalent metal cation (Fe/Co/Zn/Cd) transporter